jgi:hypothetical protein
MAIQGLDVFSLRDTVVDAYKNFATSFTTIHAADIRQQIDAIYASDRYWARAADSDQSELPADHRHRDAREAKTTDALVDEMLTGGILDEKGERRTGLEKAATKLPAGGGEAGKALVAQIAAMTAAVKAQDPDAGNSRDFQCEPRR